MEIMIIVMNSIEDKLRNVGYEGEFDIDCMLGEIEGYGFVWSLSKLVGNVDVYYCKVSHKDSGMSYSCDGSLRKETVEKALLYVLRTEDLRCSVV
jgi:hypothetical protein